MRTQLNRLAIALALALPVALPAAVWTTPAHAQAAQNLKSAQASYYKHLVDYAFVKQWVDIPAKKGVMLIDARPAGRKFNPGHIHGAINIPDDKFEQMKDQLPQDKNTLLIFYCEGPECVLSHNSAFKAEALGYTNVKVYTNGYPEWVARGEIGAVAGAYVKKLIDDQAKAVLVDARPKRTVDKEGTIPTAVHISDSDFDKNVDKLPADKSAELIFFCGGLDCVLSHNSAVKARKLGYTDVKTYSLGHPDWLKLYGTSTVAAAPAAAGVAPTAGVVIEPGKEKGSISTASFERILKENPGALLLIDIREPKEYAAGTIKGAVNIPMAELEKRIGTLPTGKPIVFICSTGARSGEGFDTAKLLRPELHAYFLDAKVSYSADGSWRIMP
ncbi:MAG: rhodanese [Betaproteobacteria bacterium RIFCSPLOWO2_02_FULL_66_14]|nr:MAG: rhodanese [Betaproteobacteria bacterium RIFCSPLOWO2_02_FULL_66_14]